MRSILIAGVLVATLAAQIPMPRNIAVSRSFGNPGQVGLFIAASDGSDERPLLDSKDSDYDPVWAPDGSSIVFTSDRAGSADLFRVRPDGTSLERLTTDPAYDDQAAFSPDGKQLVFVSTRGGGTARLWTMDLATRRVKALTSEKGGDFRPSWSPDGKWIAFSSSRYHNVPFAHGRWERLQLADIYIIHPDRSGLKKIAESGGFCGSPKWMPDSWHVVAYCMTAEQTLATRVANPAPGNDTKLVSIDIDTGASTDLPAGPGVKINPSPLPGNEIGYVRKDKADPGGGIYYVSGKRGPRGDIRTASWSPDGKRVVFHKRLTVTLPALTKTFTPNPNYELSLTGTFIPAFSPSGDRFVTNSRPSPNPFGASLFVTTVATGQSAAIYQDKNRNVLAGQWSPQGDKIIFGIGAFGAFFQGFHELFLQPGDRVEGGAQIAIINPDGTGFWELTSGSGNSAFPSFSPDGHHFVYRAFEKDGYGLRIMDLEAKAVTALTHAYDNFPLWSPRGDLIMFARLVDDAYEIHTIKPDGTGLKRLTFTHGNEAHMAWSPDGESIAFASSRMGFKDEGVYTDAPQPYGELFVMRYNGTHVEQITDNQWEDGTPAWQPMAVAQLASTCIENSPERRGEVGCSIIENKLLPDGLKEPLFWHIDRFDSAERARTAVSPASVAFEAAGTSWLMTIESQTSDHHGGRHVAQVGPLPLPRAPTYSMQVMSAAFTPGMYSLVHHHSGVEAVYVIKGEACYETPTRAFRLRKGETLAMPGGTPMRAVVTGSTLRYVLAVIVHDAAQPATMRMEEGTGPQLVACN